MFYMYTYIALSHSVTLVWRMGTKRTVTIRGVDGELYDRVTALAREMGKTVGEVVNEALRLVLAVADRTISTARGVTQGVVGIGRALVEGVKEGVQNVVEISDIEELEISREDLESSEAPILFRNIKKLVFSDDITLDLIESKIYSIVMCDEIIIPRTIPKIELLKKCRFVKRISVRSST